MHFSVLLSVYTKENPVYLDMCLESIWDKQILKPSQIVLVKDGVLKYELNLIIQKWQEKLGLLITVVELTENIGLGEALNKGIAECRYDLVARMDTDDISLPDRFIKQVNFMFNNPDIAVSSGTVEEIDESDYLLAIRKLPLSHLELLKFAKRRCPISHPAAIFRKKPVLDVGGYPPFRHSQDYALWSKMIISGYELGNMPDLLVKMRSGNNFFLRRRAGIFFSEEIKVYHYMYSIKFFSLIEYAQIISLRSIFSILPIFVKKLIYRFGR